MVFDASTATLRFLAQGGEMGALTRAHDWRASALGEPAAWPQSLKTAVRLLLNTRHPMLVFWGPEHIQLYNDSFAQSIGPDHHPRALGRAGRDSWPSIWPILGPQVNKVMLGQGATWNENALVPITRNGQHEDGYWTYSYSPIDEPAAPNGVGGVLVVCNETTAIVQAQQQKCRDLDLLQTMFQRAPGAIALLSGPQHRFELVNEACMALIGRSDLVGKRVIEAAPDAVEQGFIRLLDRVYSSGEAYVGKDVVVSVHPTGSGDATQRVIDFIYQPVRGDDGCVSGIFVQANDITERKRAQDQLQSWNQELEKNVALARRERDRAWNYSSALMVVATSDGVFREVSPAWSRVLGHDTGDVVGHSFVEFLHPEDVAKTLAVLSVALQRHVNSFKNRYRHKDGSYRWISWDTAFEDGLIFGFGRDITLEQEQAQALALASERLRQAQKMEAVGQLTGGLAHDFNNLLTGISGSLELLERRALSGQLDADTVLKYTVVARGAAQRAASLTHRLLAFSRQQTLAAEYTDVNALVEGMKELVARTVGTAIDTQTSHGHNLWPVLVDQNQLENALLNLCINARDALPDGGKLTIETANIQLGEQEGLALGLERGDYVSLAVVDSGTGMTPAVVERAFDPFFTTKPPGEGTGLGLSMVYGFAKQSGGQVRLQSAPGKGTRAVIYLPRHFGEPGGLAAVADFADSQFDGHGQTVLLVDDDASVRMFVAEILNEHGCVVLQAESAARALEILHSGVQLCLLVSDIGLPGGTNGRQLAEAARTLRPQLKVLFITGYARPDAWGGARLPQGMEILVKPFTAEALASRVELLLG